MRQKGKWFFLVLIFIIALSAVSGVFILRRGSALRMPFSASTQTAQPSPQAGGGTPAAASPAPVESALGDIKITPSKYGGNGVAVDSSFKIETKAPLDPDQLKNSLSVKTGENFSVSGSKGAYELKFANLLEAGRIYNIIYAPEGKLPASYAFQTEPGFSLISSVPGYGSADGDGAPSNVPVNTGIELNFSETPDANWQNHFSIDPPVGGAFSITGAKAVFIPTALDYNTQYTVTVDNGLTDINGEPLDRTYKIVFLTEPSGSRGQDISLCGDIYENFLPDDEVIIHYLLSERYKTQEFSVGVYEFSDPAVFADYYTNNKNNVSGNLKQIDDYTTALYVPVESTAAPFDAYLSFGALPEGYYLVHVSTGDISVNTMVQVNRLSVYSLSIDGDICFWINDTSTGIPAVGASINGQSDRTVTDSDGKALMHVKTAGISPITVQYRDAPVFVYNGLSFKSPEKTLAEKFYHYIYTDRSEYQSNDNINVFGVIREVNSNYRLSPKDSVTLSLGGMEPVPIRTDKYGCFSHTFSVTDMRGDMTADVKINGEELMSAPVTFAAYNKDKYIINAETDRHVYFASEQPDVNLSVTTYDGAPAPGVRLEVNTSGYPSSPRSVTTDANGIAACPLSLIGGAGQSPYINNAQITLSGNGDYYQTDSVPFIVLNADTMLEYENMPDGSINFTSSSIDRDAMENAYDSGDADPTLPGVYRGKPADLDFTMVIKEETLLKINTGEHYDYVSNKNLPDYRYSTSERIFETRRLTTSGGALALTGLPKSTDPNVWYTGDISYKDTNGREIKFSVDISGVIYIPSDNYSFELQKNDAMMKLGESSVIRLNGSSSIRLNGGTADQGRVISILTNNGILSASVTAPDNIPIVFSQDCMYSVRVFGAYFDGKHAIPVIQPLDIKFDPSDQQLNVAVKPDQNRYKPGGEPSLDITVTDQNGNPKQATVNISMVDDAALTAADRSDHGFLDSLYDSTAANLTNYNAYTSYEKAPSDMTAEVQPSSGASGAPQNIIRKDFGDNPVFESVETDVNGKAALSVKLPDSAARWRIMSHAISTDYFAGSSCGYISAALPFYLDLTLSDEYIYGDDVRFAAKPNGSEYVFGKSPVSYSVELKKDGDTVLTQSASQTGAADFDLGVLDTGDYTLDVSADMGVFTNNAGAQSDTVEKAFRVSNSGVRLNLQAAKTLTAEQPQAPAVAPVEPPVNIMLYNADYALALQILNESINGTSDRTDRIAASAFASDYLDNDGENTRLTAVKGQITWNNGIPEQIGGSGDPVYTARFAAAFPELIDKSKVNDYVNDTLRMYADNLPVPQSDDASFEINRAAGYFLQAAVGGSVLYEIDSQVDALKNAGSDDSAKLRKLLYAAAYCAIGADDKAAALFDPDAAYNENRELADVLTFYIDTSLNRAAALTYLQARGQGSYVSDICERINYIRKTGSSNDLASEASLRLDGDTENVSLNGYGIYFRSISVESYKGMLLKPVSGSVSLNISYSGRPADLSATQNIIGLEKSIISVSGSDNMYDVVFSVNMPDGIQAGYYTIRDRVPGNMRFTQTIVPDGSYNVNYLEKQLVDIGFYYDGETQPGDIRYRVIKVSPAGAVVERAYISRNFMIDQPWGASKPQ